MSNTKPKIIFSHVYPKLLNNLGELEKTVRLLEVLPVEVEQLHESFLNYDTYVDKTTRYSLPDKGKFLILIFYKPTTSRFNLFTTIRRDTPGKEKYYRDLRGEWFDVHVKEI